MLTVLGLFGKLTRPDFDPFHVIGREAMKESKFYQEIMEEGEIKADRKAVLRAIEVRFGKASAGEFKDELQTVEDANDLSELHRIAIKCRTIAGFRKLLARKLKSQPTS